MASVVSRTVEQETLSAAPAGNSKRAGGCGLRFCQMFNSVFLFSELSIAAQPAYPQIKPSKINLSLFGRSGAIGGRGGLSLSRVPHAKEST